MLDAVVGYESDSSTCCQEYKSVEYAWKGVPVRLASEGRYFRDGLIPVLCELSL